MVILRLLQRWTMSLIVLWLLHCRPMGLVVLRLLHGRPLSLVMLRLLHRWSLRLIVLRLLHNRSMGLVILRLKCRSVLRGMILAAKRGLSMLVSRRLVVSRMRRIGRVALLGRRGKRNGEENGEQFAPKKLPDQGAPPRINGY